MVAEGWRGTGLGHTRMSSCRAAADGWRVWWRCRPGQGPVEMGVWPLMRNGHAPDLKFVAGVIRCRVLAALVMRCNLLHAATESALAGAGDFLTSAGLRSEGVCVSVRTVDVMGHVQVPAAWKREALA